MTPLGNFKGESEAATQYRHYSINVQPNWTSSHHTSGWWLGALYYLWARFV